MDIRQVYKSLKLTLAQINTVASFADNGDGRTLVTVNTATLSFFGTNYVIFDSYVYPDVYEVFGVDASQFIIDTPFVSDDAGVPMYDVTEVYSYIAAALEYISGLPCADPLDLNFMEAVYYYGLYLYSQTSPAQVKRSKTEGTFEIEFFQGSDGTKSNYFTIADGLLKGCLTASLSKAIKPTVATSKAWQC